MSEQVHKISEHKIEEIANKQNYKCIYCEKALNLKIRGTTYSVEHLIPQVLYKWSFSNKNLIHKIICSNENIALSCIKCNKLKDSKVLTPAEFNSLCKDTDTQNAYEKMYDSIKTQIGEFEQLKNKILHRQNNRCGICTKILKAEDSTIRRKDTKKTRSIHNAMCICKNCNSRQHIMTKYRHNNKKSKE